MIIVQVFVYAWLIVTLVHFSNLATGSRYIKVIRSSEGDYFTNPDENCDPNSCNSYNSTIISGFCAASKESCACAQCRCLSNAKTYIVREKRCMSLDEIRAYEATETTNEIKYFLGQPGKSCSETCNDVESVCPAKGHGFTNFTTTLSIFRSVGVSCKNGQFNTDTYFSPDNPAYVVEGAHGGWAGRCIGFKDVNEIDCTEGKNDDIRRLCPCKGYGDSGYCFVENTRLFEDPYSCNKIPVIDLSSNGSVRRLSICKQQGIMPTKNYLSKCTVLEVSYMHGSQWMSLGKDEKSAFKVAIDHQAKSAESDGIVLKWGGSLGNSYNGVIGFVKVKCEGRQKPVCFVFKSNGTMTTESKKQLSTTSTPVTNETSKQLSTPTSPVPTGGFDKSTGDDGSSTTIAAAVTASVVLLIVICVIAILVIRRRRQESEERRNEMTQSNPTYGKGPDNSVMLRAAGGATGNAGKGKKDIPNSSTMQQDTYEVINYEAVDKRNDTNAAAPVLNSDTYETIDTVIEPTYHYADREDVAGQAPIQQSIYSLLEETNNPQQDNAYNVLARPEQRGVDPAHSNDAPRYDVLNRDQTTHGGYDDDNHVYHYAE